jgi:hypothetical protein
LAVETPCAPSGFLAGVAAEDDYEIVPDGNGTRIDSYSMVCDSYATSFGQSYWPGAYKTLSISSYGTDSKSGHDIYMDAANPSNTLEGFTVSGFLGSVKVGAATQQSFNETDETMPGSLPSPHTLIPITGAAAPDAVPMASDAEIAKEWFEKAAHVISALSGTGLATLPMIVPGVYTYVFKANANMALALAGGNEEDADYVVWFSLLQKSQDRPANLTKEQVAAVKAKYPNH